MRVEFELKYPEKFIEKFGIFTFACIELSKSKGPIDKKSGKLENEILRKIFFLLALFSFIIFHII